MTRAEAVPGAVVVRLNMSGKRKPGIYIVTGYHRWEPWINLRHLSSYLPRRARGEPLRYTATPEGIRLATADERREAGLE